MNGESEGINTELFYKEEGKEHQTKKGDPSFRFDSVVKRCDFGQ